MIDPYLSLGQNSEHNFSSSLSYDRNNEHDWFMSVCVGTVNMSGPCLSLSMNSEHNWFFSLSTEHNWFLSLLGWNSEHNWSVFLSLGSSNECNSSFSLFRQEQ